MNINKLTEINGNKVQASGVQIHLEHNTPGRAIISINTKTPPTIGATVTHLAQINGDEWRAIFIGYIERAVPMRCDVWQIFARENAAVLNQRLNINARHCQPADVLKIISEQTGTVFVLPNSEWTKRTAARFQHIGTGYDALDQLIKIWSVPGGMWHQQPDGRVYIGEKTKSLIGKAPIELAADIFASKAVTGGTLILMPRLRPGLQINTGGIIQTINSVEITGDTMRLNWTRDIKKIKATA